jgi:hypothetical protein
MKIEEERNEEGPSNSIKFSNPTTPKQIEIVKPTTRNAVPEKLDLERFKSFVSPEHTKTNEDTGGSKKSSVAIDSEEEIYIPDWAEEIQPYIKMSFDRVFNEYKQWQKAQITQFEGEYEKRVEDLKMEVKLEVNGI